MCCLQQNQILETAEFMGKVAWSRAFKASAIVCTQRLEAVQEATQHTQPDRVLFTHILPSLPSVHTVNSLSLPPMSTPILSCHFIL